MRARVAQVALFHALGVVRARFSWIPTLLTFLSQTGFVLATNGGPRCFRITPR